MSYDISIKRETFDTNYTSNTSEMFSMAFNCKEGIKILNDLDMIESKEKLELAIDFFERHKKVLEQLNPENGWGSYESSLGLLKSMLRRCKREIEEGFEHSEFEVSC